ncbi:MAG: VWA domain-containing protein [Coriobacteriia bacterium]|nr:VWA domain-containing protein [Coriobacteriia bacterium]
MSANTVNEHDDRMLEQALRGAYDQMDPAPEQEGRMLAALKAAQAQRQAEVPEPEAAPDISASEPPIAVQPVKTARKRVAPWKVALPAAACLALAAIGVGVWANQPDLTEQAAPVASEATEEANTLLSSKDAATGEADAGAYDMAAESDLVVLDGDGMAYGTAPEDLGSPNTEEYAAIDETGFVSTATSPLSTVSADVDTASYANLRRMVANGATLAEIPTGAVRIEEMLNYFDYGYASPTGGEKFSMQARVGACPWNPNTQLLVLGFATEQQTERKPANLVFLIDVSGSMDDPDKLDLLQDSFATLLEHLNADDRVSIVTYSGQEEVVLEGAAGDDDKAILRAIYRLRADGSTNGEAGLKMAYDVAERNKIEGGVNRIVMASDGDLNVGMTSESDLHDFVAAKRESGIYLSVLGFGAGNYKDNKMETLADNGNGQYHYIDCIDEAERVLSQKLMSSVVPFADDVKLQVEFNPAQVKGYRLIGYENRAMADEDFRDDTKDAGDIGPNAQFTVAYEIALVGSAQEVATTDLKYAQAPAAGTGDEWLTCTLRYRAFDDGQVHEQQLVATGDEGADEDWRFAAAVCELGMVARDSEYAGDATLETARKLLDGMELDSQRAGLRDLIDALAKNEAEFALEDN